MSILLWESQRTRSQGLPPAVLGALRNSHTADTLEGHLLREKYPIVFSNHVDPFASSNVTQALPLLEVLTSMDIPVSIQTKGGKGLLEPLENYHCSALDLLDGRPTVFYVSLETLDDDIGAISAPGAFRPTQRLEMIAELRRRGHRVCVGVNPVVPQWLPDPQLMVTTLKRLGVEGIWVQALHLSHKQIAKMPQLPRSWKGTKAVNRAMNQAAIYLRLVGMESTGWKHPRFGSEDY